MVIGHDTIPGAILAWYEPEATEASMRAAGAEGIEEDGLRLRPTSKVRRFTGAKVGGLAVDVAGSGPDGGALRGRIVGLLAPRGGGLVLMAVTSPEAFAELQGALRQVARSVRFDAAPAGGAAQLRGPMCAHSGNETYSKTQRVTFDGRGRAVYGSEFIGSGTTQDAYWSASRGGGGRILELKCGGQYWAASLCE